MGKYYEIVDKKFKKISRKRKNYIVILTVFCVIGISTIYIIPLNTPLTRKIYLKKMLSKAKTPEEINNIKKLNKPTDEKILLEIENREFVLLKEKLEEVNKNEKDADKKIESVIEFIKKYEKNLNYKEEIELYKKILFDLFVNKKLEEISVIKIIKIEDIENETNRMQKIIYSLESLENYYTKEDLNILKKIKAGIENSKQEFLNIKTRNERLNRELDYISYIIELRTNIKALNSSLSPIEQEKYLENILNKLKTSEEVIATPESLKSVEISYIYMKIENENSKTNKIYYIEKLLRMLSEEKNFINFYGIQKSADVIYREKEKEKLFIERSLTKEEKEEEEKQEILKTLKECRNNEEKLKFIEKELKNKEITENIRVKLSSANIYYRYIIYKTFEDVLRFVESTEVKGETDFEFVEEYNVNMYSEALKLLSLKIKEEIFSQNISSKFNFYLRYKGRIERYILEENEEFKKIGNSYSELVEKINKEYLEIGFDKNMNMSEQKILIDNFVLNFSKYHALNSESLKNKIEEVSKSKKEFEDFFIILDDVKKYNTKINDGFNNIDETRKILEKIKTEINKFMKNYLNYNFFAANYKYYFKEKLAEVYKILEMIEETGVDIKASISSKYLSKQSKDLRGSIEFYIDKRYIGREDMLFREREYRLSKEIDIKKFKIYDKIYIKVFPEYDEEFFIETDIINSGKFITGTNQGSNIQSKYSLKVDIINKDVFKIEW